MDTFTAGVQYDDWKGSVAADMSDHPGLLNHLRRNGLASNAELLAGFRIGSSAVSEGEVGEVSLVGYLYESTEYVEAPEQLRAVECKVTPGLLLSFFKRFDLVATRRGDDMSKSRVEGPFYE